MPNVFFKPRDNKCANCGNSILVTIFRGGAWCSDNCRKALGLDLKK